MSNFVNFFSNFHRLLRTGYGRDNRWDSEAFGWLQKEIIFTDFSPEELWKAKKEGLLRISNEIGSSGERLELKGE